jgi:hypothetical protein
MRLLGEANANTDKARPDGATAFKMASQHDHLEVMRLLSEVSADADKARPGGARAFKLASQHDLLEVMRLLCEANADTDKAQPEAGVSSTDTWRLYVRSVRPAPTRTRRHRMAPRP